MTDNLESVDLTSLNAIASGVNKKTPRIVAAGIGGRLMGTKSLVDVTAEQLTEDLKVKQRIEREKAAQRGKTKHISEQPWTWANWHQHVNWLNFVLVVAIPAMGVFEAFRISPHPYTLILGFILYVACGLSITAGYHRCFAHKSYEASAVVRLGYAFFGAGAIQGSIKWWAHSHRVHHRYTDTKKDPYDARQGLWYSHMGWMLTKPNPRYRARADISDLTSDWVVTFQHRHYLLLMILMSYVLPVVIAGYFWNDAWGGFIYAGIIRTFVIQQATFCVNSLAHWIGAQPFDDRRTPRDHVLTALCTFGEGYHNFHHEFPSDYRNALKWYQFDPTKVTIWLFSTVGLTWNLKTFSQNAIDQGLFQQQQKKLDRLRTKIQWGVPVSNLPIWDREQFNEKAKAEGLILINGIVHNAKAFVKEHPGGQALIRSSLGKDATEAFQGAVYAHSNAAHNMLATMRVAVLRNADATENTFARQQEYLDKQKLMM